jgi:hypothetical protein
LAILVDTVKIDDTQLQACRTPLGFKPWGHSGMLQLIVVAKTKFGRLVVGKIDKDILVLLRLFISRSYY